MLTDRLLELQDIDTAADRLRHRAASLPEMTAASRARQALADWEATDVALRSRLDELGRDIEAAEAESAEIDRHRDRLQAQMRTVIAPREAEALQHEIATLAERRSELDDRGLAALEEQSDVDDTLVGHLEQESSLRQTLEVADAALAVVQADIERELADLEQRREGAREVVDTTTLARYDRLRDHHGVAVARLVGHRCDGCHLDLSPAEVDIVKAAPEGEPAACPQCDRMLIR
ncbi:MAG: hypothetical protein EA389_07910 [Ilumatobacter sp.]|nr:MAG: hypothetical protein EA389_07910 [Ilumatobacter sp.]